MVLLKCNFCTQNGVLYFSDSCLIILKFVKLLNLLLKGSILFRTIDNVTVYNYVSYPENPITWEEFTCINYVIGNHYPYSKSLWTPIVMLVKNPFLYTTLKFIFHIIPAILLDAGLILTMNKPRYVKSMCA